MSSKSHIKAKALRPIKNTVFVIDLEAGAQLTSGNIIIPDDNMTERGIRDRWAKVFSVGPEVDDISPGEWVLVKHGRWSPGFEIELDGETVRLWRIDYPENVVLAANSDPRVTKRVGFER